MICYKILPSSRLTRRDQRRARNIWQKVANSQTYEVPIFGNSITYIADVERFVLSHPPRTFVNPGCLPSIVIASNTVTNPARIKPEERCARRSKI
jgi:hypothetical protein